MAPSPNSRNNGCCQCESSHRTQDTFSSHPSLIPSNYTSFCIHRRSKLTLIPALSIHIPILPCQSNAQTLIGITLTITIHLGCSSTGAAVCIPSLGWKTFLFAIQAAVYLSSYISHMALRFTNLSLRTLHQAHSQDMSSHALRRYRSGASLDPGTPDTITITVGSHDPPPSWTIPKTLLAERSHVFNSLFIEDTKVSEKHFTTITPHAFANFADYIRSSIFTTNTKVSDYNRIHAHIDACILGAQLGADEYRKAALRSLHSLFVPGARSANCNATRSTICPADIKYVCERAGAATLAFAPCVTDTAAMMRGLRFLCYDALAAHWTQRNVVFFTASRSAKRGWGIWRAASEALSSKQVPSPPMPPRTTWSVLFERFPEFRERMVKTSDVTGLERARLLRRVEEYFLVFGDVQSETSGFSGDSESDSESDGERNSGSMLRSGDRNAGAAHQVKCKRLTIKLRGLRSTREFPPSSPDPPSSPPYMEEDRLPQHIQNVDVQEMATQTEEEDMKPEYIEDIDADVREEEMQVLFRVDSHDGDKARTE